MNLFFTQNIENNIARFDDEEARHLAVLRKKIGDVIHFTDGKGFFYDGKIIEVTKKNIILNIEKQTLIKQRAHQLHIAIAPTKNIDRIEWFLEKATEMGVTQFSFVLCKNSERDKIRLDRLEKIVESAMKQSLQATLPKMNDLIKFDAFIKNNTNFDEKNKGFIAYCNNETLSFYQPEINCNQLILIGPEGDFSNSEIETAKKAGFQGISLGKNRLRTETAGLLVAGLNLR